MSYTNLQISELAYSRPLVRALGTFFNHLSDDRNYYSRLCQTLVEAYTEAWNVSGVLTNRMSPDTSDLVYQERYRRLTVQLSTTRMGTDNKLRVKLPDGITSAMFVADKVEYPLTFWANGVDFSEELWGDDYWLILNNNPFKSGFEISYTLDADNTVSDQSVDLWLYAPSRPIYPLSDQWGAVFGVQTLTEDQKSYLLQLFKSMATGPSSLRLMIGAGRAFGHPVCENDQEVVKFIITDRRGKAVITDQAVYRYPSEADITVQVEDVLSIGQPISSAVQWYDLSSGEGPDIAGLAVSQTDLGQEYTGNLIFQNAELDLLVTSQADRTKVQVELGGSLEDQQTFWDEVHTRGIAGGRTLANYLDRRPNPVGEPTAADLPTTLNPYDLLVNEALRYHTVLGVLDYSQGLLNEGATFLANWRRLMPSHQNLHIFSVMAGETGSYLGIFSNPSSPPMGMAMVGLVGYYGLGSHGDAGGEPTITQPV